MSHSEVIEPYGAGQCFSCFRAYKSDVRAKVCRRRRSEISERMAKMEPIDYVEKTVEEALKEARTTYDALHERSYKFVILVTGAAGAMAVYALGKIGTERYLLQVLPLTFWALFLFRIAGVVLMKGAATREMRVGTTGGSLLARIRKHLSLVGETAYDKALTDTRWDQVAAVDMQITEFCEGSKLRAAALDSAYQKLAWSWVFGILGFAVAVLIRRNGVLAT